MQPSLPVVQSQNSLSSALGAAAKQQLRCYALLLTLLALAWASESTGDGQYDMLPPNGNTAASEGEAQDRCLFYTPLYASIYDSLKWWQQSGITERHMEKVFGHRTRLAPSGWKGLGLLVEDGKLYCITPYHNDTYWDIELTDYLRILNDFVKRYGPALPDIEFAVNSGDVNEDWAPANLADAKDELVLPLWRYCKCKESSDILIPYWHWWEHGKVMDMMPHLQEMKDEWPWEKRSPVLTAKYTIYDRIVEPGCKSAYRYEKGKNESDGRIIGARAYLQDWAMKNGHGWLSVNDGWFQPMPSYAQYKYVLHVDGQGCSTRLEQLLLTGALVFKEESSLYSFYHHLLRPYEHYIPYWEPYLDDLKPAYEWAVQHDHAARHIASAGRHLAAKYFTREALDCYWWKLMHEQAKLQTFRPGSKNGRQYAYKRDAGALLTELKQHPQYQHYLVVD